MFAFEIDLNLYIYIYQNTNIYLFLKIDFNLDLGDFLKLTRDSNGGRILVFCLYSIKNSAASLKS